MQTNHFIRVTRFLVFVLVLAACGGGSNRHPAETTVARYYIGVVNQDTDAVMDAVEQADRNLTGMGIVNLLNAMSVDIGPLGLDLGALTKISIKDLDLDLLSTTADYAAVQASGDIRYQALGVEVPFCDIHDVRRGGDGQWYIDLDAAERMERLERILPQREAQLMALLESSGDSISGMLGAMTDSMAIALNLCE